jgi:hypothetical protein
MKAMVLALAASVGESAFAVRWRQVGAVLDLVIPIVLFITVVAAGATVLFGLAQ